MEYLSQNDPRWKNMKMGGTSLTVGDFGCTLCAVIMLSNWFYGYTRWTPDKVVGDAALWVTDPASASYGMLYLDKLASFLGNLKYTAREDVANEAHIKAAIKDKNQGVVVVVPIQKGGKHFMLGWSTNFLTGALSTVDSWPVPARVINTKNVYHSIVGARYFIHKV